MNDIITIALPKGRLAKAVFTLMEDAGYTITLTDNSRKLIVEDQANNFRYFFVKPSDVITYVEEGVCDIGVVGKDSIVEEQKDIYELLDLNIGACKMVVAGLDQETYQKASTITIATKYPTTARLYLSDRFQHIHMVKLNGSVELGPLVGLSDVIVDIYETGNTLRANNLQVFEELYDISSRLIANKASYRIKQQAIDKLVQSLEQGSE